MAYRNWTTWRPGREDTGQVDECSHQRVVLTSPAGRLSPDERCQRASRAMEVERVATEVQRAAAALAGDAARHIAPEELEPIRQKVLSSELSMTVAALNLMGIDTLLPGEGPFDGPREMIQAKRVYLRAPAGEGEASLTLDDSVDALSGLIGDFRTSTIFRNGLRIEPVSPPANGSFMLVAAHRGIMAAFGEFLARKYIVEGWNLR